MDNYDYTFPDSLAIQFLHANREQIIKSAKETYRKIRTKPIVDRFVDFGNVCPSADAVGQILGIMFGADDWKAVAICNVIATSTKLREKIYTEIVNEYEYLQKKRERERRERN